MKILVGMSGGVDSTAAALLLIRAGHDVAGAFIKVHADSSAQEARESCASLGIPLYERDYTERFRNTVVKNFIDEYVNARTPNPCVVCNSDVKFAVLLEMANELGFERIATGHYASVVRHGERYAVRRGSDVKKDQAYMLWRLPQQVLASLVLPLSDMSKLEVRDICTKAGLVAAHRKDSQEICFIPDGDYASFIESDRGRCPEGNFIDDNGNIIGTHKGIIRYTVGQRKGLGVAAGQRVFVTAIDPETNTVTLSREDKLYSRVEVSGIVFSGMEPTECELYLNVKLRYSAPEVPCRVKFNAGTATVELDTPQRAVAPGQSAVFYKDGVVVAGGFIDRAY